MKRDDEDFCPQLCRHCDQPLDPYTCLAISEYPHDATVDLIPDVWEEPDPYDICGLYCDVDCLNDEIEALDAMDLLEDWAEPDEAQERPWDELLEEEEEDEDDPWSLNLYDPE